MPLNSKRLILKNLLLSVFIYKKKNYYDILLRCLFSSRRINYVKCYRFDPKIKNCETVNFFKNL